MSEVKKVCVFDNSKECPVRAAYAMNIQWIVTNACPICPIRAEIMKAKVGSWK